MRLASLLLLGVSGIALAACSTFGSPSSKTADTPPPPVISADAKAQEAREMAAVMGEGAPERFDLTVPAAQAAVASDKGEAPASPAQQTAAAPAAHTPGVPDGCPIVEVLPDTRSITYFEDSAGSTRGDITARASIKEIRGGCEYEDNAVIVDIDMVMQGHITKAARYEGREDLEAFMTFPYFIAVMDADGNMIDKKIMATAMRFQPNAADLDHAEKITQTIPLKDIGLGSHYTIATGFQLNRQQLDYNRGSVTAPNIKQPAAKRSAPTAAPKAPAAAKSGSAKMSPITE